MIRPMISLAFHGAVKHLPTSAAISKLLLQLGASSTNPLVERLRVLEMVAVLANLVGFARTLQSLLE